MSRTEASGAQSPVSGVPIEASRARMDGLRSRIGGFAFGGDYNPEQWDRDTWHEDIELMQRAGVNLVTLGVFSWASIEPQPGVFTFDRMDEVMDLLHAGGISIDLATPTMAPPAWLSRRWPEVLPVMDDGETFGFGNRLHFDPSSPIYREHAARITDRLASRYSRHPGLAMWHISNEYGPTAYNEQSSVAFRAWLLKKYGDLDALNEAWYTTFWSQTYSDWEQVEVPAVPRSWSNPARRLDFKRFVSDALLECFIAERDIVRSYRDDLPVLTNFMRFYKNADYWRWARHEDAVALDIYPNPGEADSLVAAALNYDLMRSLKGEPWVLMEQAASSVSQWKVNNVKRPGMMRLGSYQAVAHGADTVLYFQWRASRGGHERFHSAMLPHSGAGSRTFGEICELGNELPRIAEVVGATSRADVGILLDWDAWWALTESHGLPRNDFDYPQVVVDHYRPFLEAHHSVDMVSFTSDLSRYRVIVIPNAYLLPDAFIDELTRFVEGGGTVVCSFFSGVVDADNQVRQPAYPGGLRHLIGAYIDEYWPARADERFGVRFGSGGQVVADWWQDSIHLESATALAEYTDGLLVGRAAVIENRVGDGVVRYIGTRLDADALARVLLDAATDASVVPVVPDAPAFVEATARETEGARYIFLLNHSESEPAVVRVRGAAVDLISGKAASSGDVYLPPLQVAVVRVGTSAHRQ